MWPLVIISFVTLPKRSFSVIHKLFSPLQVRVLAQDGGYPPLSDITIVYLNITRNRFAPSFSPTEYSTIIPEAQSLGSEILRVTASDRDLAVSIQAYNWSY